MKKLEMRGENGAAEEIIDQVGIKLPISGVRNSIDVMDMRQHLTIVVQRCRPSSGYEESLNLQ